MTGDLWERYLKIIENENVSDGLVYQTKRLQLVAYDGLVTRWISLGASGIVVVA